MLDNICLMSDSYKLSHYRQYPPNTKYIYSYLESREGAKFHETTFFGLQYFLQKYLEGPVVTREKIEEAKWFSELHFGVKDLFNYEGWRYILRKHNGKLPVEIKAVPEGTSIPQSNVLMTIVNTDPECYWLTNYLETLLVQCWYPCTVVTQSREMKKVWLKYLEETGSPETIDFKLHDFGFRGVSCPEQAAIGSAAHLVNFKGTDTIAGCLLAKKYYGEQMAGFSIPATEHSTITSWGKENELDAMRNMLRQYPNSPIIACVSDSYDIWQACERYWGEELKQEIIDSEKTLSVRPDSGPPTEIVPKVIATLMDKFGYVTNSKGYDVLPDCIRVIQGDGIDFEMMQKILETLKQNMFSADNIAMGSGGGLLQKLNRDTQKFAFKCSAINKDDEWYDVYKDPITDKGKMSKRGRLKLVAVDGSHGLSYRTVTIDDDRPDQMRTVFRNGKVNNWESFDAIRNRANYDC